MNRFINNIRTFILLAILMALFVLAGNAIAGQRGIIFALFIGGFMNIIAYFYSDKIAIATMRGSRVTEDEAPELMRMVRELSSKAELPMPQVYICPQQAPNAFATGRGPGNAVVAVTEGILQALNYQELRGVIAHEIAHIKHRDILIQSVAATIAGAISALGYLLFFIPIGNDDEEGGGNLLVALAMMILAPIAAAMIQMAISRSREYNADNYGAELVGDPMPLAIALEKLHNYNKQIPMRVPVDSQRSMFIVEPFLGKGAADWFNTHPSLEKRLQALIGRPQV